MIKNDKNQNKSVTDLQSVSKVTKSKRSSFKKAVLVFIVLLAVAIAFNAVMIFFGMKTNYLHRWGSGQYFGEIIEVNNGNFVIRSRDNQRLTILITDKSIIKKGTKIIRNDLKIGDKVIVFGLLNKKGQVESQFIRVFDSENPTNREDFFRPSF